MSKSIQDARTQFTFPKIVFRYKRPMTLKVNVAFIFSSMATKKMSKFETENTM